MCLCEVNLSFWVRPEHKHLVSVRAVRDALNLLEVKNKSSIADIVDHGLKLTPCEKWSWLCVKLSKGFRPSNESVRNLPLLRVLGSEPNCYYFQLVSGRGESHSWFLSPVCLSTFFGLGRFEANH